MFTGIIEQLGTVKSIQDKTNLKKFGIELALDNKKIDIGESICVNGVCLTVTGLKDKIVFFDVVAETLEKSNLSRLNINDKVNIEFSLKAGDKLSGHFVTGHIDCRGKIKTKTRQGDVFYFEVLYPPEFKRFIAPKASIAVDGISLTVVDDFEDYFSFYVIPHTIENTDLKDIDSGSLVNIEFDILAKYVNKISHQEDKSSNITMQSLKEKGFL